MKVSIISQFRDEAKFLKEWIEFHLMIGFDDFYLINHLSKDNYPILFEGLHTTYTLFANPSLAHRSIIRHHNIEHEYYKGLYQSSDTIFSKIYYLIESTKLRNYLKQIPSVHCHLSITENDSNYFKNIGLKNVITVPPFHSTSSPTEAIINSQEDKFVLYHGNLNVSENLKAAKFLIKHIFTRNNIKYVIAGSLKTNTSSLLKIKNKSVRIITNPTSQEIGELIQSATVIVLPTFQSTGIKLKLIDSLYKGKHVITNDKMVEGFPLPELVSIAKSNNEFMDLIDSKMTASFTNEEKNNRILRMNNCFDNNNNAKTIIKLIQ